MNIQMRITVKNTIVIIYMVLINTCAIAQEIYRIPGHDGSNTNTPYILTPPESAKPSINGPSIYGVRPGSEVLYRLPISGKAPFMLEVQNIPEGLSFDPNAGVLSGRLEERGEYVLKISAENQYGKDSKLFKIVVGDEIALTPPMGWNSWNAWAGKVTQQNIKDAADALINLGLYKYGWRYINIDDGWQGKRDAHGIIQPDLEKFPNMQRLCDHIHGLGLKVGIYSTPWVRSFQGRLGESSGNGVGIIRNEKMGWYVGDEYYEHCDVGQWEKWGIDYLKYDWNPMDLAAGRRMRKALTASNRDIVYSVCSSIIREDPQQWADMTECFFLWRKVKEDAESGLMAADIKDDWDMMSAIGFNMENWIKYAKPGHWNDPDMLVVGSVGWGNPKPSKLTPNEQYTQISLWAMLNAPLLLGCDLKQSGDEFTLNLLKNSEIIGVNQDEMGAVSKCIRRYENTEVWVKDLAEGSKVIGLFNRDENHAKVVTINWTDLEISGEYMVRDLWRQKDIGVFKDTFKAEVPVHGVIMVKINSGN